jgi:hypothetical protein
MEDAMWDYPSETRLAKTGFPNLYEKETEMSTTQTVPRGKDTAIAGELYLSFELGDKSWKVTASDGHRGPSRYNVGRWRRGRSCALHWQGPVALQARTAGQGALMLRSRP